MKVPRKPIVSALTALTICCISAWAWQNASDRIGLTKAELETIVNNAIGNSDPSYTPNVSKAAVSAYKALGEADRAAVVKELIAAAKPVVLSPALLTSMDKQIQGQYGGANHNLKVQDRTTLNQQLSAQLSARKLTSAQYAAAMTRLKSAGAAADAYRFDASSLRSRIQGDLRSAEYMAKQMQPMQGMPDPVKVLEMTKTVAAMPKGDDEAFRRAYAVLGSFKAGGPTDEPTVMAMVKEEQQRIYDEYAPKTKLKRGLEEFLKNAAKVNFAAATTTKGTRIVFTDPAMERAPAQVKFLYRLGKAPTAAAVEAAKEILKEL